ncbi:hypothetical protein [Spirosoma luteum]|uniref:hypothetical protein n=1 Tax=Spirosoma luteum TaxID=431553 RepID=UPI0003821293|nr:hypothetical protein [Spirosoma luteum]
MNTARITVDFGLVVLIWLVQLIIYPGFQYYSPAELAGWHPKYSNLITFIVGPLMLVQVILVGWSVQNRVSWLTLASAVLVGLMWAATAFQAVPIHNAIAAGDATPETLHWLVSTNWLRTAGWTFVFLLGVAERMLVR